MFVVRVDVSFDGIDRGQLAGASVDAPRTGSSWNAAAPLLIEGWAVGRDSAVVAAEVVANGEVVCRAALTVERPDVDVHLAGLPGALRSGFQTTIAFTRLPAEELELRAVLASGARAHVGTVRLTQLWRSGAHPAERDVVSVVIPCFNQAAFLAEAIDSALAQTYLSVELVVVDDGSTDNAGEVAARYPHVRYVRQNNLGLAAARNAGVRHSNGEFLLFLDSDDRLRPDAVSMGVDRLRASPACAFVSGEHRYIGIDGQVTAEWQRAPVETDHYLALLRGNYIGCSAAVMYRRAALQLVGGFDARLRLCEDYDLYLRIARSYPVAAHKELMADYRRYGAGMSDDPGRMLGAALAVLRSQRSFLRDDARRARAYAEGVRSWRDYYGPPLAAAVRTRLGQRGMRAAGLTGLVQLARNAPLHLADLLSSRR